MMPVHRETRLSPALIIGDMDLVISLGKAGIPLLLGSENGRNPAMYSKYGTRRFTFSSYNSLRFIEELYEIGRRTKQKTVLFCEDDRALLAISNHRDYLKEYYSFLLPPAETVSTVFEKKIFNELAGEFNLLVPLTYKAQSRNEAQQVARHIKYPCSIKPLQQSTRSTEDHTDFFSPVDNKIYQCTNHNELEDVYQTVSEDFTGAVIQEHIPGDENAHYFANLFLDKEGDLRGCYIAKKERMSPGFRGRETCIMTVENQEILELSYSIAQKLNIRGLISIELKKVCNSCCHILMGIRLCNTRNLLGLKSGANLAYLYYIYVQNLKANPVVATAFPGVKYIDIFHDVRAFADYYLDGKMSFREWWESVNRDSILSGFSSLDLFPSMMKIWTSITEHNRTSNPYV